MFDSEKYFDSFHDAYEEHRRSHGHFADFISKNSTLSKDSLLVDIGCGTGNETIELRRQLTSNIIGLDTSESMLSEAKPKSNNVTWINRPAEDTGLEDNNVDCITLFFVAHYLESFSEFLGEAGRILKDGGQYFIFTVSHNQLKTSMEYCFFPKLLDYDLSLAPSIEDIKQPLKDNGFSTESNILPYANIRIDEEYVNAIKERYRSSLTKISKGEIEEGTETINNVLEKSSSYLYDRVNCTVIRGIYRE